MPKSRPPDPAEFRRQMVELVRAGRDPNDLAREFEPSAQAIRNWVADADRSEGRRDAKPPPADPGLTAVLRHVGLRCKSRERLGSPVRYPGRPGRTACLVMVATDRLHFP